MLLDVLECQVVAVGWRDGDEHGARNRRYSAGFVVEDVAPPITQHRVRWTGQVCAQGHLVSHGPGHDEESRLVARQTGHVGLEVVGRRVFDKHVVPERRVGYGVEHGFRGSRHHVAAKVEGRRARLLPSIECLLSRRIGVGCFDRRGHISVGPCSS